MKWHLDMFKLDAFVFDAGYFCVILVNIFKALLPKRLVCLLLVGYLELPGRFQWMKA